MSSRLTSLLLALTSAMLVSGPVLARPVVVELFTSQGCSSCPPAEALLGELAGRDDLLALGFHVTYWDDLGWKDTASFAGATERQATYAGHLGEGNFTPQLVIDGRRSVVGSRRAEAASAVAAARAEMSTGTEIAIARRNGRIAVTVGSGKGSARVILVGFDRSLRTLVARGENSGRTLVQANVVRSLRTLNDVTTLDRAENRARLSTPDAVAMRADWTQADPAILAFLRRFGRFGIPLVAVYGPGLPRGEALPDLLTPATLRAAIERGERASPKKITTEFSP